MKKEFVLKKSPLLKIVLDENEFEIINQQYKNENGTFEYAKLYDIEFREKSTDYSGSILIFILSLFVVPGSKKAKFKERIVMNYDKKQRKIILFDFDKQVTLDAIEEIRKNMNSDYSE